MAKVKQIGPDVDRFLICRSIINDLYEHCGDAIRSKKTVKAAACRLADMEWMVNEIDRLPGAEALIDVKRFANVSKQVKQVCKERRKPIAAGSFIDMSGEVFARYRFLVLTLEKVILSIVDEDERERITDEKVADEDTNAVSINLTDPDDPEDVKTSDERWRETEARAKELVPAGETLEG